MECHVRTCSQTADSSRPALLRRVQRQRNRRDTRLPRGHDPQPGDSGFRTVAPAAEHLTRDHGDDRMSATGNEADTDLERMLTASLHEHAATIVTTRLYVVPDRITARAPRRPVMRYRWLSAGLAVAIVAVGVVVRVEHNGKAPQTGGPQQCVRSVPNDFAALVAANRIPGATGTVVSGYSDGTLL